MPNPGLAYKITELLASSGPSSWPAAAAPANDVTIYAALRKLYDSAMTDAAGNLLYSTLASPRCVVKSADVLTGTDPIFTISGGPVRATLYGRVTTLLVGASSAKITHTTDVPAATIDLCSAVVIDDDAAGTSYRLINTTAVFTPVTAGAVIMGNAFATDDTEFLLQPGSVGFNCTAARVGVVEWCMMYTPLSPASRVVAAA